MRIVSKKNKNSYLRQKVGVISFRSKRFSANSIAIIFAKTTPDLLISQAGSTEVKPALQ